MGEIEEIYIHPVRCYTCGKVVAHLTLSLEKLIKTDGNVDDFLTSKGIPPSRYCCRRTLLTPIRGLFLDKDSEIEEEIYTPETFEETHNTEEEIEETEDVARASINAFRQMQKNVASNKSGLYTRGRKKKGKPGLTYKEVAEKQRGVPGKSKKK